ncbi:hypothetical protein K2Z84_31980 [Candidatus Binatia bacterium]|nr:hypothetical protein [Candidatus Binatia bacterium]
MGFTVTKDALIKRVNRRLAPECLMLRVARGDGMVLREYGRHYVVDLCRNQVERADVDVEEYARELGVMKDWEQMREDEAA